MIIPMSAVTREDGSTGQKITLPQLLSAVCTLAHNQPFDRESGIENQSEFRNATVFHTWPLAR